MKDNGFFPEIRGNLGFGLMRLPMKGEEVDCDELSRMVDAFLDAGFNYFDTAHPYHGGKSEVAMRECLSKRHDRREFLVADKLTEPYFEKEEDIRPFFEKQLEWCGVDYFDFYLMHAQNAANYGKFQRCNAYGVCSELKKEGRIRHLGISFHDRADILERILDDHPEIEFVQIQFNYLDYESSAVDSRNVYEACERRGLPVVVMEPLKGGTLANLPEEADEVLRGLGGGSNASYALRFAASFPNMAVVLSRMGRMDQMEDNIGAMKDFEPVSEAEKDVIGKVRAILNGMDLIQCTGCRYCIEENDCPMDILIPDMFWALNSDERFHDWTSGFYYRSSITAGTHGKASDCVECGNCEYVCPQSLPIRELLKKVAERFETGKKGRSSRGWKYKAAP